MRQSEDKLGDLIALLHQSEGSAIVYTRSRGGTRDTALALQSAGIPALYYHAGLPTEDKNARQEAWQNDRTRVMVATNAFGMGIDKPDVRLVVHLDPPDSLEAYFQEAGRAGRDGAPAEAILLTHPRDVRLLSQRIAQTFPPKEKIREVYDDVAYYLQIPEGEGEEHSFEFDLEEFCRRFRYFPLTVVSAFAILERAGYLLYTDKHERRSRLMMIVKREELYRVHNRVAEGDKVLTALFRTYTGLFADYVFIEEKALAAACGLSEEVLYEKLIAMNRARLLHYIPHKSVSTLRYLTRRTLGERLNIGADAYRDASRPIHAPHRRRGALLHRPRHLSQPNVARVFRRSRRPRLRTLRRLSADARSLHARCSTRSELISTPGRRSSAHGRRWHVAQLDAERAGQLLQQFLDEGRILFDGAQLTLPAAPTSPEN